jgi:hypothetical protein
VGTFEVKACHLLGFDLADATVDAGNQQGEGFKSAFHSGHTFLVYPKRKWVFVVKTTGVLYHKKDQLSI